MINLEWLRTFRAVYKTKSLSAASELLNISQPTVSQQVQALEAHLGQKLFNRKSKGVLETDEGRILNTLISGAIEEIEEVEHLISQKNSKIKSVITIGISSHLYKSILCHQILELGEYVHIKFGTKQELISDVQKGTLLYAIVPEEINTFDAICNVFEEQDLVLVSSPDVDLNEMSKLIKQAPSQAQRQLSQYKWYTHNTASSYIKLYWIEMFNKKRPNIIPNYVIPNEFEVLQQLSSGQNGLSVAVKSIAKDFVDKGLLKQHEFKRISFRKLSLISNKKKAPKELTTKILGMLSKRKM